MVGDVNSIDKIEDAAFEMASTKKQLNGMVLGMMNDEENDN